MPTLFKRSNGIYEGIHFHSLSRTTQSRFLASKLGVETRAARVPPRREVAARIPGLSLDRPQM